MPRGSRGSVNTPLNLGELPPRQTVAEGWSGALLAPEPLAVCGSPLGSRVGKSQSAAELKGSQPIGEWALSRLTNHSAQQGFGTLLSYSFCFGTADPCLR